MRSDLHMVLEILSLLSFPLLVYIFPTFLLQTLQNTEILTKKECDKQENHPPLQR